MTERHVRHVQAQAAAETVERWRKAGTSAEEIRKSITECTNDPGRIDFAAQLVTAIREAGMDKAVFR